MAAFRTVNTYPYCDANGDPIFFVERRERDEDEKREKTFRQYRLDERGQKIWNLEGVARVPYRLTELHAAIDSGEVVLVVEGEKDVDNLRALGFAATTNAGGVAWHWNDDFVECFRDACVIVIADNDEVGRTAARTRAQKLLGIAKDVRLLEHLPEVSEKGDITDLIEMGWDRERLMGLFALAQAVPPSIPANTSCNLIDLRDVRVEPIDWLVSDRVPFGEVTIVEGPGGIGKTTALLDLIARLSRGSPMPDETPSNRSFSLIIAEEDRESVIKARLLAADADLSRIRLVAGVGFDESFFLLPTHCDALRSTVCDTGAKLVLIDALFSHFDDSISSYRSQDVRRALRPLVDVAHETGAAVLGVRHWRKAPGKPGQRGLGSIDITNIVRSVLCVAEHPDDEGCRVIAVAKTNLGKPCLSLTYRLESVKVDEDGQRLEVARLAWGDLVDLTADDLSIERESVSEEAGDRQAVDDWLRDYLSGVTPTQQVLADGDKAGFSRSALYRAAKRQAVIHNKPGFGGTSTWAPPQSSHPASQ